MHVSVVPHPHRLVGTCHLVKVLGAMQVANQTIYPLHVGDFRRPSNRMQSALMVFPRQLVALQGNTSMQEVVSGRSGL